MLDLQLILELHLLPQWCPSTVRTKQDAFAVSLSALAAAFKSRKVQIQECVANAQEVFCHYSGMLWDDGMKKNKSLNLATFQCETVDMYYIMTC